MLVVEPERTSAIQQERHSEAGSTLIEVAASTFVLAISITGLAVTFGPFCAAIEWGVLLHTLVGVLTLLPVAVYLTIHWLDYKHYAISHVVLLGYLATVALVVCVVSGAVVTAQGLFALQMSNVWRQIHLISTYVVPPPNTFCSAQDVKAGDGLMFAGLESSGRRIDPLGGQLPRYARARHRLRNPTTPDLSGDAGPREVPG